MLRLDIQVGGNEGLQGWIEITGQLTCINVNYVAFTPVTGVYPVGLIVITDMISDGFGISIVAKGALTAFDRPLMAAKPANKKTVAGIR